VILSYFRFAAGVCVLATGLLMGGAGCAIALADSESGGSTAHGVDGADGSSQRSSPVDSTASNSASSANYTARKTLTSALGLGRKPGPQAPTSAKSPKTLPVATDENKGASLVAAVPTAVAPVPSGVAPVANEVAPVASGVAPVASGVAPVTSGVAPVASGVAPVASEVAPVANQVASAPDAAAPVTNTLAQAPGTVAPDSGVTATVQDMLASVIGGIVAGMQLPSSLSSWFGVAGAPQPAVGSGVRGFNGAGPLAAHASVPATPAGPSQLSVRLAFGGTPSMPAAGGAAGAATLEGFATTDPGRVVLASGTTAAAHKGASPMNVQVPFGPAFGEILRSASLAELAAAALPGLGGLLIITAAGVHIGHRQAKAGFAVQTAGIARFTRAGPLGVVRSGSLVVIHRRTAGAEHPLDQAA
jgi:hypothetical protein